jgi:hypothetical protein
MRETTLSNNNNTLSPFTNTHHSNTITTTSTIHTHVIPETTLRGDQTHVRITGGETERIDTTTDHVGITIYVGTIHEILGIITEITEIIIIEIRTVDEAAMTHGTAIRAGIHFVGETGTREMREMRGMIGMNGEETAVALALPMTKRGERCGERTSERKCSLVVRREENYKAWGMEHGFCTKGSES